MTPEQIADFVHHTYPLIGRRVTPQEIEGWAQLMPESVGYREAGAAFKAWMQRPDVDVHSWWSPTILMMYVRQLRKQADTDRARVEAQQALGRRELSMTHRQLMSAMRERDPDWWDYLKAKGVCEGNADRARARVLHERGTRDEANAAWLAAYEEAAARLGFDENVTPDHTGPGGQQPAPRR